MHLYQHIDHMGPEQAHMKFKSLGSPQTSSSDVVSSVVSDPSGEKIVEEKNRADTSSESVENDGGENRPSSYDL